MEVKSTPYTHLYGLRDVVDIVQGLRDAIIAHSKTDEQMKQDAIMLSQRLCNITLAEGDKVSAVYEIMIGCRQSGKTLLPCVSRNISQPICSSILASTMPIIATRNWATGSSRNTLHWDSPIRSDFSTQLFRVRRGIAATANKNLQDFSAKPLLSCPHFSF